MTQTNNNGSLARILADYHVLADKAILRNLKPEEFAGMTPAQFTALVNDIYNDPAPYDPAYGKYGRGRAVYVADLCNAAAQHNKKLLSLLAPSIVKKVADELHNGGLFNGTSGIEWLFLARAVMGNQILEASLSPKHMQDAIYDYATYTNGERQIVDDLYEAGVKKNKQLYAGFYRGLVCAFDEQTQDGRDWDTKAIADAVGTHDLLLAARFIGINTIAIVRERTRQAFGSKAENHPAP